MITMQQQEEQGGYGTKERNERAGGKERGENKGLLRGKKKRDGKS